MKRAFRGAGVALPILIAVCLVLFMVAGFFATEPFFVENSVNSDPVFGELHNYGDERVSAPDNASALLSQSRMYNVVIFICFSDEVVPTVGDSTIGAFNGDAPSLQDYYYNLSYGAFTVESLFPIQDTLLFVYRDNQRRDYYDKADKEGKGRYTRESALLNAAIRAARAYLFTDTLDLDVDKDGYVDSVSFIINGDYNDSSDWGKLLWPHSWDLESISSAAGSATETLNGLKVKKYAFNFLGRLTTGLLCHEFGHVLGLPDLYHYDYNTEYLPVGYWDLMHQQGDTPQMMTTYLRHKYLGFVTDDQIVELEASGTYSLSSTSFPTLGGRGVLAYKITVNQYESIWMEYRDNTGVYDNATSGTGLIIYRINNKVTGNEKGRYQNANYPDEVYVYRPSVAVTGSIREKEMYNLKLGYLSPDNQQFSSVGKKTGSGKWDQQTLYLTDGSNTGFTVTATDIETGSTGRITFHVDLNDTEETEIQSMYVEEGSVSILYGETPNITLRLRYAGMTHSVIAPKSSYTINYDPGYIGKQTATVVYHDGTVTATVTFQLTTVDYIPGDGVDLTTLPLKREYALHETVDLTGLDFTVTYASGKKQSVTYSPATAKSFTVTNFDGTRSGVYHARILYTPLGISVTVELLVLADLDFIKISARNTKYVMKQGEPLSIHVIGVMKDGSERRLEENEYQISGFQEALTKVKQTLTVTSLENDAKVTVQITVLDDLVTSIMVSPQSKPKTSYKYGEMLNLSGGELIFVDAAGVSISCPMESYYNELNQRYNPTAHGVQTLSFTVDGVIFSMTVTVEMLTDSVLVSHHTGISIYGETNILLHEETDAATFRAALSSYLTVILCKDGKELVKDSRETVDRSFRVLLLNKEGVEILTLNVYLVGDANGDGILDERDIDGLSDAILHEQKGNYYFDENGDGIYNLTDFVLLVAKIRGRIA